MNDVESKIKQLMMMVESLYYADDESDLYVNIRSSLEEIKNTIDDTYNIFDIWYQDGCNFPFEINMKIYGEERMITFNNIREMLFTIRLLK